MKHKKKPKPKPADLGTGMAAQVAEAMQSQAKKNAARIKKMFK